MFRGSHYHSVDDKGRVIIPLRFRSELGNQFVVTKGMNHCLFVFREDDFSEMEKKLQAQPLLDQHAMRLQRYFSADALETQVDNQGRIALPSSLREFAGIDEEVAIIGAGSRIEIWARAGWDAFNATLTDADIALSALEVGLGK